MARIQTALITVADKTGVAQFAQRLVGLGVELLATGGTARLLRERELEVTDVSEYTGFPEILDGGLRVLHPKVTGGVLARRDQRHLRELEKLGIRTIDMVVVNLYPHVSLISQPGVRQMQAIEDIDIAGPTVVRAAAKNYTHVAVVTNPATYDSVAEELESNDVHLSEETHFKLALDAFRHTAHYDAAIARYFASIHGEVGTALEQITLEYDKRQDLRYGENPHQRAAFYVEQDVKEPSVSGARQVAGPVLSFSNALDLDAGIELAKEFERPVAVIVKLANPCGVAVAKSLTRAYEKAYLADPRAAFGSAVVLNRPLDADTARAVAGPVVEVDGKPVPRLVECLAAPGFEDGALDALREKADWAARTRLLEVGPLGPRARDEASKDFKRVTGGVLLQDRDLIGLDPGGLKVVTGTAPSAQQMRNLKFAWLCCKHVTSNAIVVAKGKTLVGVGAGQMSRLDATVLALTKAGARARGAVLASDGFFRFPDAVQRAAEAGVAAIIQSGGAEHDQAVIEAAEQAGIAMVFTGIRHFRH